MLIAYGAGGTWRSPLVRAMLRPLIGHTKRVYQQLARDVAAEIADHQDSGLEPVGVIGIAGSPSCGVHTTLDLPAALEHLVVGQETLGFPTTSGEHALGDVPYQASGSDGGYGAREST
jgi:hypothetical protein